MFYGVFKLIVCATGNNFAFQFWNRLVIDRYADPWQRDAKHRQQFRVICVHRPNRDANLVKVTSGRSSMLETKSGIVECIDDSFVL